jgi:hypothetical protein
MMPSFVMHGALLPQLTLFMSLVFSDMSATAFFEPLPVIDFVAQLLNTDIHSRPLSDAERVKVYLAYISSSRFII